MYLGCLVKLPLKIEDVLFQGCLGCFGVSQLAIHPGHGVALPGNGSLQLLDVLLDRLSPASSQIAELPAQATMVCFVLFGTKFCSPLPSWDFTVHGSQACAPKQYLLQQI